MIEGQQENSQWRQELLLRQIHDLDMEYGLRHSWRGVEIARRIAKEVKADKSGIVFGD